MRVSPEQQDDDDPFPAIAARCHVAGYDWTSSPSFDGPTDPRGLPLYPWKRERFWFAVTTEAPDLVNPPFDHPLLGFRQRGATASWLNHLDEQVLPWIADHAIEGVPVLPAAAILEMALAAARWRWPDAPALEVFDVEVRRPMPFDKGRMRELRTVLESEDGDWELASRSAIVERASDRLRGRTRLRCDGCPSHCLDWAEARRLQRRIEGEKLYRFAHLAGLDYGARFRTVTHVEIAGPDSAIAYLDPSPVGEDLDSYLLHPALLDGALQGLFGLLADRQHQMQGVGFLPWRFGRRAAPGAVRARSPPRSAAAHADRRSIGLRRYRPLRRRRRRRCGTRRLLVSARRADRRRPVDERALRVDLVPAPLAEPGPRRTLADFRAILSRLAAAREPSHIRQEQALLLDALIGSVAFRSLEKLVEPGRSFAVSELINSGRIAPDSAGIADCLLRLLERFGAATETELEWRLEASHDLPEVSEVWRLLLSEAPDLVAELALIAAAAEDLPRILTDGIRQPDAQLSPMAEHLLQASPAIAPGVELLCDALAELAMAWPKARPMRILELGASSGGATRRMLNRLAQSGVALAYLATSTDSEQAARLSSLARSFRAFPPVAGRRSMGMKSERGNLRHHLGGKCLRALAARSGFPRGLRDLLVPGGFFVAVEPEPNALWDVVFGQSASGGSQRLADDSSPLRSARNGGASSPRPGSNPPVPRRTLPAAVAECRLLGLRPSAAEPVLDDPAEPTLGYAHRRGCRFPAALQETPGRGRPPGTLARSPELSPQRAADGSHR